MIRSFLKGEQTNWDVNLGCLAGAYRCTQHDTTKFTPNMIMLGREVRQPYDVTISPKSSNTPYVDFVESIRNAMQKAHEITRKHLGKFTERQRELYDAKMAMHIYTSGDEVWMLHESRKEGVCPKLEMKYEGPYLVLAKISNQNYKIQLNQSGNTRVIHHDKLKPYEGTRILTWAKSAIQKYKKNHQPST